MPLVIEEMFVFVADEMDGEGIPAYQMGAMLMPLIGADRDRVNYLRRFAQEIADASGRKLTLARFTVREDLEEIKPRGLQ